jgi:hypothetical protein
MQAIKLSVSAAVVVVQGRQTILRLAAVAAALRMPFKQTSH